MDGIDDVEGIDACGVQVLSGGRGRSGAVSVIEDLPGRRLGCGGSRRRFVGHYIVSSRGKA